VSAKSVALIPECAGCEVPWLPADEDRWFAYLTDDEPPELAFYCPECAEREFSDAWRASRTPLRGELGIRSMGVQRVVVVAKLKPGSESAAADIVGSGPPYDPGEIGLARHGVYLGGSEVVFVFEGPDVERHLRDLLNDPVAAPAFAIWAPLLEGTPSIAHQLFYWESTPELDS
jgi:hypothetical protein